MGDGRRKKQMPRRFTLLALGLLIFSTLTVAGESSRVQLTFDTSEAHQVLAILERRAANKPVDDVQWQQLFATEPYKRLKAREKAIGERFKDPSLAFSDEDFKKFVMSDALLARSSELRKTLANWKNINLQKAAEGVLSYLPESAMIRAKVFPVIKPNSNSFVWETSTDPAIFLYLDPEVSAAKFANTVAHELHHIGLASAQAQYDERIKALPERANITAEWVGAFGEGLAMLAAAGGPGVDPHAASSAKEHARWEHDMARFDSNLAAVNAFFLDILNGKFANRDAIDEKGSSFFGAQGPWYTVGYKMAVIVEKRFGRLGLIGTMLDPRQLLALYNRAAAEHYGNTQDNLPLWSEEVLKQIQANAN
jgi:hypothetical protein